MYVLAQLCTNDDVFNPIGHMQVASELWEEFTLQGRGNYIEVNFETFKQLKFIQK